MSVAILERKVNTENEREVRDNYISAEEKHNSQISANYARLINPENSIRDILARGEAVLSDEKSVMVTEREPAFKRVTEVAPYRVENARANADIFRADSLVNKRSAVAVAEAQPADEEDDEDLRPTQTTIQYQTVGVKKTEEGKIATQAKTSSKRTLQLTKKDKITVAVAFAVIVALFVLIIVNSAIIAGLNNEVSILQDSLAKAESVYTEVLSQKNAYMDDGNLFDIVSDFASNNGMILR